jgi:hypothetical protein
MARAEVSEAELREEEAPHDWTDDEHGLSVIGRAIARTFFRARFRVGLIAIIGFVLTAVLVARRASAPVRYTAEITLRITESGFDTIAQRIPRNLRDNLLASALTSGRLATIIREQHLYARLAETDMPSAIASLREDMTLEVGSNYLLEGRSEEAPPRDARVTIKYSAGKSALAVAVADALANALVEAENEKRIADTDAAELAVTGGQLVLRERYDRAVAAYRALQREDAANGRARPSDETERARIEQKRLGELLAGGESQRTALALVARAEVSGLGMRIDRVGESVSTTGGSSTSTLVIVGGVTFTLLTAVIALIAGAFDPHIRDARDIEDIGPAVLVAVPKEPHPHANQGSPRAGLGGM